MIIEDILSVKTGKTRTDGRYPLRIGCTVTPMPISCGCRMFLDYVADRDGKPKEGVLCTSPVQSTMESDTALIVKTENSIYILRKDIRHGGVG